jgi:hypothetical protein
MKKTARQTFGYWLPLAATIICIHGTLYYVAQQYTRLSANEVPAQYATDAVRRLAAGATPAQSIAGIPPVDIEYSLSPVLIIYDSSGAPICGTTTLNGHYPAAPKGALEYSRTYRQNRITWMPQYGLRLAAVIMPCEVSSQQGVKCKYYVLAARSLDKAQQQIAFAGWQIRMAAIVTLAATFVITLVVKRSARLNSQDST